MDQSDQMPMGEINIRNISLIGYPNLDDQKGFRC
jgi:hypothetical protein